MLPPTAPKASVRAMMTKSRSRRSRSSRAARYLPIASSRLTMVLPAMWPQRFGKRWSSRWMPATPVFTNSCTVRIVDRALPYPSSASAMMGTSTALATIEAIRVTSVMVRKPMSGQPLSMASE